MTRRALAAALLAAILWAGPALAGGRYSGDSRGGGAAALPGSLASSEYLFTEKSFFKNSENNRSQFRNGFAKRSLFGHRVDRTSRLKRRFAAEAAAPRVLAPLPNLEIFQPAERPPRVVAPLGEDPPLDAATRREIADLLLQRSAP